MANFVTYSDATALFTEVGNKLKALAGAYIVKGNSTFAGLPATPAKSMVGFVYNVTDQFTTDSRFVEGTGKKYPAGTNVAIGDFSTYDAVTPTGEENPKTQGWYELVSGDYVATEDETVDGEKTYYAYTESYKYDVIGAFVDVDAITNNITAVSNSITTATFDSTQAYAIGDIVKKDFLLYKFKAAHTANTDWDASEVDSVTVLDLIAAHDPASLTTEQINALKALLS